MAAPYGVRGMFLFTLSAILRMCRDHMTLFTFDRHNLNISTDRKKDGVQYEIYRLWLRRIQCRNRILIFHLITTKASVSLKIGGS